MNPATLQADALVAEIERQRDAQVDALRGAAEAEAAALRSQANDKALRERRRAAAEARDAARRRLQQLQAGFAADARRAAAETARAALARAEPRLAPALRSRWQDAALRQAWCARAVAVAKDRLAPTGLVLRYPADLPTDEAAALAAALQATPEADPRLDAGLHVSADGAWVDVTPTALLADSGRVAALLRAALEGDAR